MPSDIERHSLGHGGAHAAQQRDQGAALQTVVGGLLGNFGVSRVCPEPLTTICRVAPTSPTPK